MTRAAPTAAAPAAPDRPQGFRLTGRKVLMIAAGWFGVVLLANGIMMTYAIGTFSGLVVENPYRAAQGMDAAMRAERALGWRLGAEWQGDRLAIHIRDTAGEPVTGLEVSAVVGRPATMSFDRNVIFVPAGAVHAAPLDLAPGLWRVEILATRREDGARYAIMDQIYVPESRPETRPESRP